MSRLLVLLVVALFASPALAEPKPGEVKKFEIAKDVFMEFCWIPAGEAQLGSPKAEQDSVTKILLNGKRQDWQDDETETKRGKFKTKGFWLAKYPVTQAEWKAVMGNNPSSFNGKKAMGVDTSRFPVENVNWFDAIEFCTRLGKPGGYESCYTLTNISRDRIGIAEATVKMTGKAGFRLPHEDEWEYACRGGKGNKQAFYFGEELNGTQANVDGNYPFGTDKKGPHLDRPCAVDGKETEKYEAHPWGLHHVHGNVWHWCENLYDKTTNGVLRGGSWCDRPQTCRTAVRSGLMPALRLNNFGFRVCFRPD
jgi:formylglycine-generating enzyme required for sulfatase activity